MMHSSGIFMPERPVEESAVVAKKNLFHNFALIHKPPLGTLRVKRS